MHSSGQWIQSSFYIEVQPQKGLQPIQISGLMITYLRRYAASSVAAIYADLDSDGEITEAEIDQQLEEEIERLIVEAELGEKREFWDSFVKSENLSQEDQILQLKRRVRTNKEKAKAALENVPDGDAPGTPPDGDKEAPEVS